MSDLDLMEIHVDVLFEHDIDNRLTVLNEPPGDMAPLVFIGSTRSGNVVRYSSALDMELVEELGITIEMDPDANFCQTIRLMSAKRQIGDIWFGPAYVFPSIQDRIYDKAVQVTLGNKDLLKLLFPYTFADFEHKQPCYVIFEDGRPVSICCSARQTSKAAEASLYTCEGYRGRGYGANVASAWANEVQKQGRIALYSTSWDNFASRAVAARLKLTEYGIDFHIS